MKLDFIWIQASFTKKTLYDYSFVYFHVIVQDQANTISYIVHGSYTQIRIFPSIHVSMMVISTLAYKWALYIF